MAFPRTRRYLLSTIGVVALGTATTIAVSWAFAWSPPPLTPARTGQSATLGFPESEIPQQWCAQMESARGVSRLQLRLASGSTPTKEQIAQFADITSVAPARAALAKNPDIPKRPYAQMYSYELRSFGWPARAMYFEYPFSGGRAFLNWALSSARISSPMNAPANDDDGAPRGLWSVKGRSLPTHILWTGFAINTFLFSKTWGSIFGSYRFLRRWRRKRRRQCAACASPLAGLRQGAACPECGRAAA